MILSKSFIVGYLTNASRLLMSLNLTQFEQKLTNERYMIDNKID